MNSILQEWQTSLSRLYQFYLQKRAASKYFFLWLFLFFVVVNDLSFWWAMVTALPELVFNPQEFQQYFKVQFPVAILGALFDSLSFLVTIFIVKKALKSSSLQSFIGMLSVDLVIALLATFWVVFVFMFSSWLVRLSMPSEMATLSARQEIYSERVLNAINNPFANLRNIYFGAVIGISSLIPTLVHIVMACRAIGKMITAAGKRALLSYRNRMTRSRF